MQYTEEPQPLSPTTPSDRIQGVPVTLIPKIPQHIGRYEVANRHVEAINHPVPPLLFCEPLCPFDPKQRNLPPLWDQFIHPEGMPYYQHQEMQIVTFSDMGDVTIQECMSSFVEEIRTRMRPYTLDFVNRYMSGSDSDEWHCGILGWEICVNIEAATRSCSYYVADWEKRCIFWLEGAIDNSELRSSELGLLEFVSYEQLQMSLECQFWKHAEFFSEHRDLPYGKDHELVEWLLWAITDRMTSLESTVVYSVADMRAFLEILTCQNWNNSLRKGYFNTVVARHWHEIVKQRVHNMHGEHTARLNRSQSRFFQPLHVLRPRIWTWALSTALLFKQPFSWYDKLSASWVDNTVFFDSWKALLKDAQDEWKSLSLLATVVLAANMGFLAIDALETSTVLTAICARTLSAVSTIVSFGAIMSSLLLLHDYQEMSKPSFTVDLANEYLEMCRNHVAGLFGAAMVFSLPFAMTMWSLIFFLASILTYIYSHNPSWSAFTSFSIAFCVLVILGAQISYFFGRAHPKKASVWKTPPDDEQYRWIQLFGAPLRSVFLWSQTVRQCLAVGTPTNTMDNSASTSSAVRRRPSWWFSGSTAVDDENISPTVGSFRRMFSWATSPISPIAEKIDTDLPIHRPPDVDTITIVSSPTIIEPPHSPMPKSEAAEKLAPPDNETQSLHCLAPTAWLRPVLRVVTSRSSRADVVDART